MLGGNSAAGGPSCLEPLPASITRDDDCVRPPKRQQTDIGTLSAVSPILAQPTLLDEQMPQAQDLDAFCSPAPVTALDQAAEDAKLPGAAGSHLQQQQQLLPSPPAEARGTLHPAVKAEGGAAAGMPSPSPALAPQPAHLSLGSLSSSLPGTPDEYQPVPTRAERWSGFKSGIDPLEPLRCTVVAPAASSPACVVPLRGGELQVLFPFPPEPPQMVVMQAVATALFEGRPALLESPTGTGKTLATLCPILAFQLLAASTWPPGDQRPHPHIIVAVRTHDQVNNMVKELRKTVYRPLEAKLVSRERYCVHEGAQRTADRRAGCGGLANRRESGGSDTLCSVLQTSGTRAIACCAWSDCA